MPTGNRIPILYLAPWVDLGGSDKGTIDWFKHIDRERWTPSLITTQPSPNRWLHHVEPHAEEVWDLPDLMAGGSFPEFILGFIESRGVRVVHIMNSRLGFDLLPDMACLPEPPVVVVQTHAEEPNQTGYVRYVTRRYGNLIDAFSVTSEHLKGTVADYEIPPSRIEVIHSGVDGEREFNPALVEPLPLDEGGVPRILWPGRLVDQKDPMLTLDALARARELGGEFVLDIVGDGPMKGELLDRAEELDVSDVIRWHPPSQEMARWYRSADLMLMTSVFEGVPYVIYESLAMGVPVVAPALPGNVEFMDGDSGVLIDPRDDADLYATAIVDLLEDRSRREEIGEQSRRRMLAEFSLAKMGRLHDELYLRLLGARPVSSRSRGHTPLEGENAGLQRNAGTVDAPPLRLPRDPSPDRTIGVIVPCYRHGIFLDACIDSIKAQTLTPASIVVVDDGSEDPETIEALDRLDGDPDVAVVRQAVNRGPSAARNTALRHLETSYVLPIDADDKLLPDALERMLTRLETAPEDIGFVYPHAQHFGNRTDFMRLAAYNLWLLMQENFIPAPCLFDRRVFGAGGVEYPEDIVIGHEDWDLILQLAERGVHGLHADGPTFLYRRRGFSRINSVEYGQDPFHETIERRHAPLYGNRDAIKARWSPALSIVLFEEGDGSGWSDEDLSDLPRQTCSDFELVANAKLAGGVRVVDEPAGVPETWLQEAIHRGLGRCVCLLTPAAAPILRNPAFVEQLLYAVVAHEEDSAIALGCAPEIKRHAFSQLDDGERLSAHPVGIAFERPYATLLPEIDLESRRSVLVDLVMGMQLRERIQWRVVPVTEGADLSEPSPRDGTRPKRLDINHGRTGDRSEIAMRDAVGSQPPRLPELTVGTVRRWDESEPWTPPETQLLYRHAERDGDRRTVSNDPQPPPGHELEFVLGAARVYAAPGARRLILAGESFELSDNQNELDAGARGLGYLEQQPLPLLERLELRTMPETGREVLVAGPEDPLNEVAKPLATMGWLEAHPIQPRRSILHTGPWGVVTLFRQADGDHRRHRYAASSSRMPDAVELGLLHSRPQAEFVALLLRDDGHLATDLTRPGRASRDPRKVVRWVAGPLKEARGRRVRAAADDTRARLRHLLRQRDGRRLSEGGGNTLGWLRREPRPGWNPLFSATHPVTGDQLVTRSGQEASEAGYLVDGVLGYVRDARADHVD